MITQVLSISQMRELKKLGIDITNASMYWEENDFDPSIDLCVNFYPEETIKNVYCTPTFTFEDILKILPKYIKVDEYEYKWISMSFLDQYAMQYIDTEGINPALYSIIGNSLLETAFETLKWCVKNKYV